MSIFDRARDVFEASGEIVLREDTPVERAIRHTRDGFRRRLGEYPERVEVFFENDADWYAYAHYQGREFAWRVGPSGPFGRYDWHLYLLPKDGHIETRKMEPVDSLKDLGRALKKEEVQ